MKTITTQIIAVALILGLLATKLCSGQTVAIGHVTAEVIESVSAASNALTSFALGTPASGGGQATSGAPTVNLGTMTINSGSNATVNVVLKPATLSGSTGSFTLDPSLSGTSMTSSITQSNGSQKIQLLGTANLSSEQSSGLYEGSYTVVFAYN